jgi:hypothetical protein
MKNMRILVQSLVFLFLLQLCPLNASALTIWRMCPALIAAVGGKSTLQTTPEPKPIATLSLTEQAFTVTAPMALEEATHYVKILKSTSKDFSDFAATPTSSSEGLANSYLSLLNITSAIDSYLALQQFLRSTSLLDPGTRDKLNILLRSYYQELNEIRKSAEKVVSDVNREKSLSNNPFTISISSNLSSMEALIKRIKSLTPTLDKTGNQDFHEHSNRLAS